MPVRPSPRRSPVHLASPRLAVLTGVVLGLLPAAAGAQEFSSATNTASWTFAWGGYLHAAYRWIDQPKNFNLAGKNNGFQLEQARLGANVQYKNLLAVRVTFEGATEDRLSQSFPGGTITTRLRDAYLTWAPLRALRVTVGQMITPWDVESMRSDSAMPFVSRSVAVEGVQPQEGRALRGLGEDRNLGIMLHSADLRLGSQASFRYALFVGNGNGENRLLNDNNLPAVFGRVELSWWRRRGLPPDAVAPLRAVTDFAPRPVLSLGLAGQYNPRTAGNPPALIDETDAGAAVDVVASFAGVDLQAGFLYLKTFHTSLAAVPDLERLGTWAHVRWTLPRIPVAVTPGYRISYYSPRAHLSTTPLPDEAQRDADLGLIYHTFGVAIRPTRSFPLNFNLNYTLTTELGANVLANDRVEADVVAVF